MHKIIPVIMILASHLVSVRETGARYLIITHDDYYSAVLPLAEWKTQKGVRAKIVRLSDIGCDSAQIRAFVVNAYNTWQARPEYLLLVGNKYQLPFPRRAGTETCYTDNYYTNITGDFRNEIIPGRFWVSDTAEAKTVVAKVLSYERNPFVQDSLWFGRGVTIVNFDSPILIPDTNYVRVTRYANQLMIDAGFNRIDSLIGYYWGPADFQSNNSNDVIDAINRGCSYITYRGTAGQIWSAPFHDIQLSLMNNGYMLPIVISATCLTLEGIGRLWLPAGSPEEPKGVVGFMGTTTGLIQASAQRSALMHGSVTSIFRDSLSTLGRAVELGRITYHNLTGDSLDYDGWSCFGDPEMTVRTRTPQTLEVTHADVLNTGACTAFVSVSISSLPVENALVCLMARYDTTVYNRGYTNDAGQVAFIDTLKYAGDSLLITVTARNTIPYCGLMRVHSIGSPYVLLNSYHLNDTIGGNCDGIANPGEDIDIPFWLMNWGDTTAHGITAVIRKTQPDADVTLSDTIKYVGDIAGLDSIYVSDGFNAQIAPRCSDLHCIHLGIEVTDTQDSIWLSYIDITVHAPVIVIEEHYFPGHLAYTSAGDTNQLLIKLNNIGTHAADNTVGVLRSNDSSVMVIDSVASFGSIMPDSTASNSDDPFVLATNPNTPLCHPVSLQMEVSSGVYVDTLECVIYVGTKDYCVWDPDPNHTSGPVIHERLAALGYYGDYETLFPYDIVSIYRSLFICCGESPSSYVIKDTSRAADEIAFYLNNQGGKVYFEGGLIWRTDPLVNNGYDFGPLFCVDPETTAMGYISRADGCQGTFCQNMVFRYEGSWTSRDYIDTIGGSLLVFKNVWNDLGIGVASNHNTVGMCFELGYLRDSLPPSTRLILIDSMMDYFGIEPTAVREYYPIHAEGVPFLSIRPNPSRGVFEIEYGLGQNPAEDADLCLYDISGRLVKDFLLEQPSIDGITLLMWTGIDDHGRKSPCGVYFLRLRTGNVCEIRKVVYLR